MSHASGVLFPFMRSTEVLHEIEPGRSELRVLEIGRACAIGCAPKLKGDARPLVALVVGN